LSPDFNDAKEKIAQVKLVGGENGGLVADRRLDDVIAKLEELCELKRQVFSLADEAYDSKNPTHEAKLEEVRSLFAAHFLSALVESYSIGTRTSYGVR
jgi:hypothetical protein